MKLGCIQYFILYQGTPNFLVGVGRSWPQEFVAELVHNSYNVEGNLEFWKSPGKIVGENLVRSDQLKWTTPIGWQFKGKTHYVNIGLNMLSKISRFFYSEVESSESGNSYRKNGPLCDEINYLPM